MTAIDFIAHHSIQMQNLRPIKLRLLGNYECNELIGPNVKPTGASIAVVTDHLDFQPSVNKENYEKLVHVSHDLSDVDVYRREKRQLKNFDLILAPSEIHANQARKHIGEVRSEVVGWTKTTSADGVVDSKLSSAIAGCGVVLVAWTDIHTSNWRAFMAAATKSKLHFLIKNHVYWDRDLGLPPPPNQKREYSQYAVELDEMENYVRKNCPRNITLLNPKDNLKDYFLISDVLITDYSSAALEFANSGVAVETGKPIGRKSLRGFRSRASSRLANEVRYLKENDLLRRLPYMELEDFLKLPQSPGAKFGVSSFFPELDDDPVELSAAAILELIER